LLIAFCAFLLIATTDAYTQRIESSSIRKDAMSTMFKNSPADTVFSKREVVSLRFMADTKPDSISALRPDGFTIMSGPWTRREFTQQDGVSTELYGVVYEIQPVKRGRLVITSPTFHFGERKVMGDALELWIQRR
jgi:hypothetical protein